MQMGTPIGLKKIPGKMETEHSLLHQICLNLPIKRHNVHSSISPRKKNTDGVLKSSPPPPPAPTDAPLGKTPCHEALKFTSPHTPQGQGHAHAHASLQPPVSPGLPSISLLTDLRVGQDFQSFLTIYLSLQVSGGTQPDPQPLSQLLICLYGFILCVKPAHNSITVRVTKLSLECHK